MFGQTPEPSASLFKDPDDDHHNRPPQRSSSALSFSRTPSMSVPPPAYQQQQQHQHDSARSDDPAAAAGASTVVPPEPIYFSPSPVRQLMASRRNASASLPPVRVDFGGPLACEMDILSPAHFSHLSAISSSIGGGGGGGGVSSSPAPAGHAASDQSSASGGISASVLMEQMKKNYRDEKKRQKEGPTVRLSRSQQLQRRRALEEDKARLQKQVIEEEQRMQGANRDQEWEERRELVNSRLYSDFGPQAAIFKKMFMQEDVKKRRDEQEQSRADRRRENVLVGRVPPPQVQPPIPAEVFTKNRHAKTKTVMDMENLEVREEVQEDPVLSREEIEEIEEAQFERTGQSPMFHNRLEVLMSRNRRLEREKQQQQHEHSPGDGHDGIDGEDYEHRHHADSVAEVAEEQQSSSSGRAVIAPPAALHLKGDDGLQQAPSQSASFSPSTPMLSQGMMLSLAVSDADAPTASSTKLMTSDERELLRRHQHEQRKRKRRQQRRKMRRSSQATQQFVVHKHDGDDDDDAASDISDFARQEFGDSSSYDGSSSSDLDDEGEDEEEEQEDDDDDAKIARAGAPSSSRRHLPESYNNSVQGLLRAVHLSRSETQKRQLARTMQQRGCEMNNKRRLDAEERFEKQQQQGVSGGVGRVAELMGTGYNNSNIDRHDPAYSATAAFIARRRNDKSIQEQALDDLNTISAASYVDETLDKFLFFKNTLMGDKKAQQAESIMSRRGVSSSSAVPGQQRHRPLLMNANELRKQHHAQAMAARAAKQSGKQQRASSPSSRGGAKAKGKTAVVSTDGGGDDDEPLYGNRSHIAVGSSVKLGGRVFVFDEGMRS